MTEPSLPDELALRQVQQFLRLLPQMRRWGLDLISDADLAHGLTLPQLAVLNHIAADIASPVELARRQRVTPAVITKLVDRLERRGYVLREPDPGDRRRLRLALTPAGQRINEEAERVVADALTARLAAFSADELVTLGAGLALLERVFATPGSGAHVAVAAALHPSTHDGTDEEETPDE
ncbi:MAG: MarR family transcriptional regulator [Thermomicrobiales bacterium]